MIQFQDHEVVIFCKAISNALFGTTFEQAEETLEYDFSMNYFKRYNKLATEDKLMHHKWFADYIVDFGKNSPWVNGAIIYKNTLKYKAKSWWSIVKHHSVPTIINNTLVGTNAYLVATFMV